MVKAQADISFVWYPTYRMRNNCSDATLIMENLNADKAFKFNKPHIHEIDTVKVGYAVRVNARAKVEMLMRLYVD